MMTAVDSIVTNLLKDASCADAIRHHAAQSGTTVEAVVDLVAVRIACRFLDGELTFTEADSAANSLWIFMQTQPAAIPALGFAIFDAFDQGEYHHEPGDDPVASYTIPRLREALETVG